MRLARALLFSCLTGCTATAGSSSISAEDTNRWHANSSPSSPSPTSTSTSTPTPTLAPLAGVTFPALPVEGFLPAVLALPLGATTRRPILIGVHGTGDCPDWQCYEMQRLVRGRAFCVCPRGVVSATFSTPTDTRYEWRGQGALAKEIEHAVAAVRAAYPDYVDDGPLLYEGFSYGAMAGVAFVSDAPSRYPRVVLTEGGSGWTLARAKAFAKNGGERVLFACGQLGCVGEAKQAAKLLEKVGIPAKVVYGKGEGHGYGTTVASGIQGEFAWLTDGDARWTE